MDIGENIRVARKAAKLDQQKLGDLIGLSRSTIVNIEKNRHNLNSDKIQQLCKILHVDANFILMTKDDKFQEECFEQMFYAKKNELDELKSHILSILKIVNKQ